MHSSTSPNLSDANLHRVINYLLKMDNSAYPVNTQKTAVIRYTKLPDFDFDAKASWSSDSYRLPPRLRRIITIDADDIQATRSLRSNLAIPPAKIILPSNVRKRKIVTITEDEECDVQSRFSKTNESVTPRTSEHKAVMTDVKGWQTPTKTNNRLTKSTIYGRDIKASAKTSNAFIKKEVNVTQNCKVRSMSNTTATSLVKSTRSVKEREPLRQTKTSPSSRISISKTIENASENEKEAPIKNIYDNLKTNISHKKPVERPKINKNPISLNKTKSTLKEMLSSKKPPNYIHVPVDRNPKSTTVDVTSSTESHNIDSHSKKVITTRDVEIETDPVPVEETTQCDNITIDEVKINKCDTSMQTDYITQAFDDLTIPNVTLTTDKTKSKEDLAIPSIKIVSNSNGNMNSGDMSFCNSSSYIYSHATLTYTTRQKINFVVGNSQDRNAFDDFNHPKQAHIPLEYPLSVMSVLNNEGVRRKTIVDELLSDESAKEKNSTREEYMNCLNELKSLDCSYVVNKLIKPSDLISAIRINNGLLQTDYICEQFQRELNFIDSFYESLQYLENCSLSDKCFSDGKVENLVSNSVLFDSAFDIKNLEYDTFLSKLENGTSNDTETMASKSLCLLNLLIRDEQRRAKNLLFVLKMREDALKDFTKSQILWLEKKKKQDNTDISTLKKKQRGALLKLQHECGEMQRMRKALLTLSEKRKQSLLKTKKNIELKVNNNLDEHFILGKKKMKRSTSSDRNTAPLKCFDLSSSGCEETTSKHTSDATFLAPDPIQSAEKCVQTNEILNSACSQTEPAENFIAVDGGYLNILFHNLSLPQIFSSGRQYEVKEEALKNIVSSSNCHNDSTQGSQIVEKLRDQIRDKEDSNSTASTARSLVDEFDQYYKTFLEDDKSSKDGSPDGYRISESIDPIESQDSDHKIEDQFSSTDNIADNVVENLNIVENVSNESIEEPMAVSPIEKEIEIPSQVTTGPLPVPVGAPLVDSPTPDVPTTWQPKTPQSSPDSENDQSMSVPSLNLSPSSSPHIEAEELRKQQLAIEREIKALEQQQCRMLVVREIPDKPPPPYTPPTENRTPKPPRLFTPDATTTDKIHQYVILSENPTRDLTDVFDTFLRDFCKESVQSSKQEFTDKPWDACNLLPQKPPLEANELVQKTAQDLEELLTSVPPTTVSGVSSRRSDHIDDILFAEWRRCEPEWTALHTDEVIVKNQLFESIFQKILTETIDEYKKTVHCVKEPCVT